MKEDVYISHNFLRISLREVWELEDTCIIVLEISIQGRRIDLHVSSYFLLTIPRVERYGDMHISSHLPWDTYKGRGVGTCVYHPVSSLRHFK